MANIVIGGFEAEVAQEISSLLRARRHFVRACDGMQKFLQTHGECKPSVDLLIFESSIASQEAGVVFDSGLGDDKYEKAPPALLCVATDYRGPEFELELSRRGVHLVYVS